MNINVDKAMSYGCHLDWSKSVHWLLSYFAKEQGNMCKTQTDEGILHAHLIFVDVSD